MSSLLAPPRPEAAGVAGSGPAQSGRAAPRRAASRLELLDLLVPAAWLLWALGVGSANTARANSASWGLLAAMPGTFYLGLALIVIYLSAQLVRGSLSHVRLGLAFASLVVMVQGVIPILYRDPRYYWVYKTIGETQYDAVHGSLNLNLDIYQRWPGFFAVTAWLDKVGGVASPLSYAAWCQVFFDLLLASAFGFALLGVDMTTRQRWLGVVLFWAGDWVATSGQDVYAPQTIGLFFSFLVLGIVLRWMRGGHRHPRGRLGIAVPLGVAIVLDLAMLITHPLSPYVVLLQLAVLVVVARVRPRWAVALACVIGVAFLGINISFLNNTYGLLAGFGRGLTKNVGPPSIGGNVLLGPNHDVILLLTGLFALMAAAGILRRRAAGREWLAVTALAVVPVVLVAVVHYGAETSYRVLLFSLPWLACLSAFALWPEAALPAGSAATPPRPFGRVGRVIAESALISQGRRPFAAFGTVLTELRRRASGNGRRHLHGARGVILGGLLLATTAMTLVIDYSQMEIYVVPSTDVQVAEAFYAHAAPGIALYLDGSFPESVGARYNLFLGKHDYTPTLDSPPFLGTQLGKKLPAITRYACSYETPAQPHSYLVMSNEQAEVANLTGQFPKGAISALWTALRHSKDWRLIDGDSTAAVYENVSGCTS